MSVEFIGSILPRRESELLPPIGTPLQPVFVTQLAAAYERSPFSIVRIGQTATSPDATVIAHAVLAATKRLAVSITLPPDVVEPAAGARSVATLATLFPGRVQVRVPATPESDRHVEFAQLLRRLWAPGSPVDHNGTHYDLSRQWSVLHPDPIPLVTVDAGPELDADERLAASADTCFLPLGAPADLGRRIARLRAVAGSRPLHFGITVRVLLAARERDARLLTGQIDRIRAHGRPDPWIGTLDALAMRLAQHAAADVDVIHLRGYDPLADVSALSALAQRTQNLIKERRGHVDVA